MGNCRKTGHRSPNYRKNIEWETADRTQGEKLQKDRTQSEKLQTDRTQRRSCRQTGHRVRSCRQDTEWEASDGAISNISLILTATIHLFCWSHDCCSSTASTSSSLSSRSSSLAIFAGKSQHKVYNNLHLCCLSIQSISNTNPLHSGTFKAMISWHCLNAAAVSSSSSPPQIPPLSSSLCALPISVGSSCLSKDLSHWFSDQLTSCNGSPCFSTGFSVLNFLLLMCL